MSFKDEVTFTVPVIGTEEEVEITFEFSVTSWGNSGSGPSFSSPGEPPEPPEYEIDRILIEGEEVTEWEGTEIAVEIVADGHFEDRRWIPGRSYGRFRERKLSSPLWESLAEAGSNYINENYEFEPPEPDYDDYY